MTLSRICLAFKTPANATQHRHRGAGGIIVLALSLAACSPMHPKLWGRELGTAVKAQNQTAPPELARAELEAPDEVLDQIRSTLKGLSSPSPAQVAKVLGAGEVHSGGHPSDSADSAASSLTELGDLDGDGVPELALKWLLPEPGSGGAAGVGESQPSWGLYLLSWDGAQWRASRLVRAAESLEFRVIRLAGPLAMAIAVITVEGEGTPPAPAVYGVKDHAATLLWDGRAEESRYQGYAHGRIEFQASAKDGLTEMVVSGRADPGLLVFPPAGGRGFDARAVYRWDGRAFIPEATKYSANPDYTLYRFISALHLRDFRAAYALIDPAKFLKTDAPSLKMFRQVVEDVWPEFLDDQVFEARLTAPTSPSQYVFELPGKHYVYFPQFGGNDRGLLVGLERREE